jgi:hypothetical protein
MLGTLPGFPVATTIWSLSSSCSHFSSTLVFCYFLCAGFLLARVLLGVFDRFYLAAVLLVMSPFLGDSDFDFLFNASLFDLDLPAENVRSSGATNHVGPCLSISHELPF